MSYIANQSTHYLPFLQYSMSYIGTDNPQDIDFTTDYEEEDTHNDGMHSSHSSMPTQNTCYSIFLIIIWTMTKDPAKNTTN